MTDEIRGDGRNARRNRSRERIVLAAFDIVMGGNWRPSVKEIAARAGVSVRTVFDIFGTIDDGYEALIRAPMVSLYALMQNVTLTPDGRMGQRRILSLIFMGKTPVPTP